MVLHLLPPALRALHLLVGTLVWAALVVLVFHSGRTPELAAAETEVRGPRAPAVPRGRPGHSHQAPHHLVAPGDHCRAHVVTPAGLPTWSQCCGCWWAGTSWPAAPMPSTLWFDRDIDTRMSRTRLRPIAAAGSPLARARVRRRTGDGGLRSLLVSSQLAERLAWRSAGSVLRLSSTPSGSSARARRIS